MISRRHDIGDLVVQGLEPGPERDVLLGAAGEPGQDAQRLCRRFVVEGEGGGTRLKAMLFRAREGVLSEALLQPGAPLHLAGLLRAEAWNGAISPGFVVTDAAPA